MVLVLFSGLLYNNQIPNGSEHYQESTAEPILLGSIRMCERLQNHVLKLLYVQPGKKNLVVYTSIFIQNGAM